MIVFPTRLWRSRIRLTHFKQIKKFSVKPSRIISIWTCSLTTVSERWMVRTDNVNDEWSEPTISLTLVPTKPFLDNDCGRLHCSRRQDATQLNSVQYSSTGKPPDAQNFKTTHDNRPTELNRVVKVFTPTWLHNSPQLYFLSKYTRRISLHPFITFTCTDDYRFAELIFTLVYSASDI